MTKQRSTVHDYADMRSAAMKRRDEADHQAISAMTVYLLVKPADVAWNEPVSIYSTPELARAAAELPEGERWRGEWIA